MRARAEMESKPDVQAQAPSQGQAPVLPQVVEVASAETSS
jgi:hypothetical protein